jgi:hypothetical protein
MPNPTIAEPSFSHIINAPTERVDIADWLLHLPNAEHQRCCPPAHIACGTRRKRNAAPAGSAHRSAEVGISQPEGQKTG